MTADDCVAILRHLPVIKQVAGGEKIWFAQYRYDHRFIGWRECSTIILGPLRGDYYFTKPRYKIITDKNGNTRCKPIPPRCSGTVRP